MKLVEKMLESKVLWYGVSTVIIIGLILSTDVSKFISSLSQINPLIMGMAFFSGVSIFLVWGFVWHSFFKKLDIDSDLLKSYKICLAGNFMNSVTPLGQTGGEPFMAYIVSNNTNASYERSLSAVIISDVVNAAPLITYSSASIVYLFLIGETSNLIFKIAYMIVILVSTILALGYLAVYERNRVAKLWKRFSDYAEESSSKKRYTKYLQIIEQKLHEIKNSFSDVSKDPVHLVKILLIAHLALPTQIIALYLILAGLGVDPAIPGIILTITLGSLAVFSPTPGGSGTFEAAFAALLILFYPGEIAPNMAVAAAVLYRLTTYWPGIPLGYLSLLNLKRGKEK